MKSLRDSGRVAVDSNVIISALLRGKASGIIETLRGDITFYTTAFNISEITKYIPFVSHKLGVKEGLMYVTLESMPLVIKSLPYYRSFLLKADEFIGRRDDSDAHLLALALKMKMSIWTNDRDFVGTGVRIYTTWDIISKLSG